MRPVNPSAPPQAPPGAPSAVPDAAMREPRWQVRLLGTLEAGNGTQQLLRFPSRAVATLLARLALAPERAHAREELVELLWPGVELAVGRNRLRQALSTLKSLLEPAGEPGAAVLQADRLSVRVVPGGLGCDARRFEQLVRAGQARAAAQLYRGELMPGYFDDWVHDERQRLAALHERLAETLANEVPAPTPAAPAPTPAASTRPAPDWRSLLPPLPAYLTRLFGAEQSVAHTQALVRGSRLVTLLGPGGSGKTRLAVEVVQALRDGAPGPSDPAAALFARTAFVSLVSCEQAPQMLAAMARALQLPADAGDDSARLVEALAGQPVLLVLDNFEQLQGHAQAHLAGLLSALPQLHLLVTSRRALGLDGETLVGADPLPLPEVDADLAVAAANPAVALFVDRARAVRSDFHLSARNHAAVAALVRALHGMPLAIELAASRVRNFSPAEMVGLLGGEGGAHLALLARGGPRAGHDARHASMSQVIAWSWRLLDPPAQRLLAALSGFAGDATASALAVVLREPPAAVAARLDDLASHSLLRSTRDADGAAAVQPADGADTEPLPQTRFGLLEPVREYVRAHWPADDRAALEQAMHAWALAWARGLGPVPAPAQVARELRNVHAVLAAAERSPAVALQLALALRSYWDAAGLPVEQQTALEKALQQVAADDAGQASDVHEMLAYTRFESGFSAQALAHAEAALQAAGAQPSRRARALVRRAWVDLAAGRSQDTPGPEADRLLGWLQEAQSLARACGDHEAQARALHQLAVMASHHAGDWSHAEALLEQSQQLWQLLGDRRKALARLRNRAQCWARQGRLDEAQACFEHCERLAREDGDAVGQIDSLLSLSSLLSVRRRWSAALEVDRRCVALCWQRWSRHGLGYALWNPPRALARLRRPEPAMRLMGFAATFWQASFGPLSAVDRQTVRRVRALVRAQLGEARAEALWAEGAAMDVAQAVSLALRC
jgi:predicted ATPase